MLERSLRTFRRVGKVSELGYLTCAMLHFGRLRLLPRHFSPLPPPPLVGLLLPCTLFSLTGQANGRGRTAEDLIKEEVEFLEGSLLPSLIQSLLGKFSSPPFPLLSNLLSGPG